MSVVHFAERRPFHPMRLHHELVTDEELAPADELGFVDPFAEWHDEMEEL
ncbi:hypothetical protein ACFV4N_26040 [Actinosynnema sp. NPDC059797]